LILSSGEEITGMVSTDTFAQYSFSSPFSRRVSPHLELHYLQRGIQRPIRDALAINEKGTRSGDPFLCNHSADYALEAF
jgi:hypothetical protein